MIEHKNNINYVFLLCYYIIGEKALSAQNLLLHNCYSEITASYNINELIKIVDEIINVVDGEFKEITTYQIEDKKAKYIKLNQIINPKKP